MLIYANKWPLFPFIPALKQSVFTPISKNKTSAIEVIAQKEGVRVHVQKKKKENLIGSFCIRKELIVWEHQSVR